MLMDLDRLIAKWGLSIDGVLHLGGHTGEEAAAYDRAGVGRNVVWVEADPAVFPRMQAHVSRFGHHAVCAVVSDQVQDVMFHRANNEESSSILPLGTHATEHPDVVYVESIPMTTTTVDLIMEDFADLPINLLVADLQGAEGLALAGAVKTLEQIDYLYLEINDKPLYEDCMLTPGIEALLPGFKRVETEMTQHGWGDALLVRR